MVISDAPLSSPISGSCTSNIAQVATLTRIRNSWSPSSKLRATRLNEKTKKKLQKIPSVYRVKPQPVSANEKSYMPYSLYKLRI